MLQLLDKDTEYQLREETQEHDETFIKFLYCESIYHNCTIGFQITEQITRIRLFSKADPEFSGEECLPSLVLFDALDARVHEDPVRKLMCHRIVPVSCQPVAEKDDMLPFVKNKKILDE